MISSGLPSFKDLLPESSTRFTGAYEDAEDAYISVSSINIFLPTGSFKNQVTIYNIAFQFRTSTDTVSDTCCHNKAIKNADLSLQNRLG